MNSIWISHARENENAEANLILFTYAGGNASSFAPWKSLISKRVSVYPIMYPGRATRINEEMPREISELAENIVRENEELFEKKFICFSHCTGSLIAYEVCKYVKAKYGKEPEGFIASCASSPNFSLFQEDVSEMNDTDFLKLLLDTNRIDEQTAKLPNFVDYYLPVLKQDFIMVYNYKLSHIEKLTCPFDTIIASNDELVKPEQVHDWQKFSEREIRSTNIEGEHFYLEKDRRFICNFINERVEEYLEYKC